MTAQFLTQLQVKRVAAMWVLTAPLRYGTEIGGPRVIVVPKGFITDFASVPRLPMTYLLAGDTAHAAAVIHDFLYRNKLGTRRQADAIFFEAMAADGEPAWRRWAMWSAVRVGGRWTWK